MILQALVKHYENLAKEGKVSKEGWCQAKISYAINLSKDGEVLGILSLINEETRGKKIVPVPTSMVVPEMVTRSSGVSANFLCDNSKYMLGIDGEGTNPRTLECFQAAKERHLSILQDTQGETAHAVCRFFETWNPEKAQQNEVIMDTPEEFTKGGNLIFMVNLKEAHEDDFIKEAWETAQNHSIGACEGVCLVTGKKTEISRIHKTIKGVIGAQSSGAALVSFNAPAFESYGKEQSYNAPVGRYAEFAYTTALNHLLSQRDYVFQLGDAMIVFWAENGEEVYQDLFMAAANPKPDVEKELKELFTKLKIGNAVRIQDQNLDTGQKFYILALAPNAARLSVRFFYENSFGNILKNLAAHYQRMELVKPAWETREYLGIRDMLFETVNLKSKDKSPISNMAAMVLQSILSGGKYPESLFTDTLIRIRAEQGNVTWGRAGIIKAYLIQNRHRERGEKYMGLNVNRKDAAYVLGRLFSVLESIQMDANPGIKATIRDRYFNSACAAPASVFPVLIKLKNSHMKKLEREKESTKIYYEKIITEIMEKLEQFPKKLSLEGQGDFVLGYYHQVQKKFEKREDK